MRLCLTSFILPMLLEAATPIRVCRFIGSEPVACSAITSGRYAANTTSGEYTVAIGVEYTHKIARIITDASHSTFIFGTRELPGTSEGARTYPSPAPSISIGVSAGLSDAFVIKLDPDGTPVFSAYVGGKGTDEGLTGAIDSSGNIYIAGQTSSVNFPVRNPIQGQMGAVKPAGFIVKLSPDGSRILYSTYFGGTLGSGVTDIDVDGADNLYLTGWTYSSDFPVTPNAFPARGQLDDARLVASGALIVPSSVAFVSKLNASGDRLIYSSYLNGGGYCSGGSSCLTRPPAASGRAIRVDSAGNAYVAGNANSGNFPTTEGAYQRGASLGSFLFKVNSSGSAIVYSTLLGGLVTDQITAMAIDGGGNAYVAGTTQNAQFPATPGALQDAFGGPKPIGLAPPPPDIFVTKVNPSGTGLVYSTFFGGTGFERPGGIAVDSAGKAWITGATASSSIQDMEGLFPHGGTFIAGLNSTGTALSYVGRFPKGATGGASLGNGITLDTSGRVYVAGDGLVSRLDLVAKPPFHLFGAGNAAGDSVELKVSPGEVVSVYGRGIGPVTPAMVKLDASGSVATNLADTQVLFDGVPAPLLYASDHQINAVAPFGLAGAESTSLRVVYKGISSQAIPLAVTALTPQIFRNPDFAARAINEDGTVNSQSNPARLGSVVAVWATGLGQLSPVGIDGKIYAGQSQTLLYPVIDPFVTYAGPAPGLISGISQVNFGLPSSLGYAADSFGIRITYPNSVSSETAFVFVKP